MGGNPPVKTDTGSTPVGLLQVGEKNHTDSQITVKKRRIKMYCPNCGVQTKSDFCPSCGFEMALAKSNVSKYNAQGFMQSRKIAKYTEAELKEMDKKADIAVATMTAGGVATGLVPIVVDIPAFATALGVGVVALGKCYMYEITKEEAADLIRQFFKAASFSLAMAFVGTKITLSAFKITPFAPVVYI